MPGDRSYPAPGDLDLSPRFFGVFSPKDLIRIAVPTVLAFGVVFQPSSLKDVGLIAAALVFGIGVAKFRPWGRTLDAHLISLVRWLPGARTVKDGALRTRDHAYFETARGAVIGVIEVDPTNLAMQSQGKQDALHHVYQQLLATVTYPIEIHSRQHEIDLSEHLAEIAESDRPVPESKTEQALRDSYHAYLTHLNETELVETTHYITIRIPRSAENAASDLLRSIPLPERIASFLSSDVNRSDTADDDGGEETIEASVGQVVELDRRCNEVLQLRVGSRSGKTIGTRTTSIWTRQVRSVRKARISKTCSARVVNTNSGAGSPPSTSISSIRHSVAL